MEVIIISKNKIKLMLTGEEMARYGSDTEIMLYSIMEDVQNKCGIRDMHGRVFVQMFLSCDGGCEMFMTKLAEHDDIHKSDIETGEECVLTEYRKYIYGEKERLSIYRFDDMQYLLLCCRELSRGNYNGKSTVYADKIKRVYYLILDSETYIAGENLGKQRPFREFYYIKEHCDEICGENAVAKLSLFA